MATSHAQRSKWKNELLPNIVDNLARETPDALYAEYPISPQSYSEGYRKVTYLDLANAVNGAARWLSDKLGPSTDHEVLSYIGPNDIRYIVLVLAAVKAGYVLFLTSPRNSIAAHAKLFERLKCTKLLSPEPQPPAARAILEACRMQHVAVPSISELLDAEHEHYAYDKKLETARLEPFMIIHSSGSTGFPKPLIYTNDTAARNMNMLAKDPPQGVRSMDRLVQGKRVLNCFPPFHGACLVSHLFAAIPFGTVMIAPLAEAISTAQGVADALHQVQADLAFLVPSIVLELSQDDKLLDYCAQNLTMCFYAGGDLPQAIGDKVAVKLPLICQYGASEIGLTPQLLPVEMEVTDWKYVHFHPCLGINFEEVADGSFELCVKYDQRKEAEQPTFTLFPNAKEYKSRDLFTPHPKLPNLWSWCARADDIIVFLNGEKTNPISMEQHIVAQNSKVLAAIVIGAQRFQAALLLEPAPHVTLHDAATEAAFIEEIWPSIQEANVVAPAHARIEKALVLPMSRDKPVIRAGKGTIQRGATLSQYQGEIERLYRNADISPSDAMTDATEHSDRLEVGDISQIVNKAVSEALEQDDLKQDANFFEIGLDSLQALRITRKLRSSLRMSDIAVASVYSNPSVLRLSAAIHEIFLGKKALRIREDEQRADKIISNRDHFMSRVHEIAQSDILPTPSKKTIIALTGSTGTVGTHLLSALVGDESIDHVYCLDRRDGAREVQLGYRGALGLSVGAIDDKVTFLKVDLAMHQLGLSQMEYDDLRSRVSKIIHNAWPVNFNLPLDSFKPQLEGLLNLFSLSASGLYRPHLLFISSVSSVLLYRTASQLTPEEVIREVKAPFGNGYAESKFIAELLCDEASQHLGIPVSVARVGQVAGSVRLPGVWNRKEWFPSLIMSSAHLGSLPETLGASMDTVDWIPVDLLAETIVEIVTQPAQSVQAGGTVHQGNGHGAEVLHLRNPTTVTWSTLLPEICSKLETLTSKQVRVVPSGSWLTRIRQSVEASAEGLNADQLDATLNHNPAIKLLDYFTETMADRGAKSQLTQQMTLERSPLLRSMGGVNRAWLEKWIAEWF